MSKSWKRTVRVKDCASSKGIGRWNRQRLDQIEGEIPNGCWYKKLIERWDWNDWNFVTSPRQQSWDFHHPHENWRCMCTPPIYGRWTREKVEPPAPVIEDGEYSLPDGYGFVSVWRGIERRVNPETGVYEFKVYHTEWRYRGRRPCNMLEGDLVVEDIGEDEEIFLVAATKQTVFCSNRKAMWQEVRVEGWAPDPDPIVYRWHELPYFTAEDVRTHVRYREEQTRNYRTKTKFPRYGRRDRKRARNLKRSSGFPGGL